MGEIKFPAFQNSEEDVLEQAVISISRHVAHMEPGDKFIIQRHNFELGKGLFTVTVKGTK